MGSDTRQTTAFRQRLRRELALWRGEGLITDDQAAALTQRYALDQLAGESRHVLTAALYVLGALLIGGSAVSFVAAHWTALLPWHKTALLLAAMLAAHGAGFYLWLGRSNRPGLGHSLVLLGTLIFGANIFLLGQIFHFRTDFYNGFLLWTAGALAVGLASRSQPNLVVAVAASFVWAMGAAADHAGAVLLYPLVALAFVPLLERWRHHVAIAVLLPAVPIALFAAVNPGAGPHSVLAFTAAGFLYTGAAAALTAGDSAPRLRRIAWIAGSLCAAVPAYWLSFESPARYVFTAQRVAASDPGYWWAPLAALAAGGIATWAMALRRWAPARAIPAYAIGLLAAFVALPVGIEFRDGVTLMALMNLAFLGVVTGLTWSGVSKGDRGLFWSGLLGLTLLIVSRFLEYDTGLMTKSAALLVCGCALIFAGTSFERRLKKGGEDHA